MGWLLGEEAPVGSRGGESGPLMGRGLPEPLLKEGVNVF